jgi:phenylacetate-CoA ligase
VIDAGRLLLAGTERLRGSRALRLYGQIRDAPRASAQAAAADQLRRLSRLLEHAERNVPYYRELFRGLGIRARDVRTLDDFARLPVLTKDVIRERHADLVREDVPRAGLVEHHSGGSTGVPLRFLSERAYLDASEAGTYRNLAQCGWRPGEMVAFFWGWNAKLAGMPRWEFELRQWVRHAYQFSAFDSGPEQMDRWVDTWQRIRPRVALGYASTLARFAAHVERTGRRIALPRGVFSTAEKLFPGQRETLERVFGCKVYDCYGSSEVRNIATECAHGGMHVNSDFVVLETDGGAAVDGEDGMRPFLVTSLWNYGMPFIRYRNEDCGALAQGGCACGSGFPRMRMGVSRVTDNFPLADGRVVHGLFFTYLLYGGEGIENFQFHQTAPDRITLWIVPSPGAAEGRARTVRGAVERVRALAPGAMEVDVREVAAIPPTPAGKHRYTRTDLSVPREG